MFCLITLFRFSSVKLSTLCNTRKGELLNKSDPDHLQVWIDFYFSNWNEWFLTHFLVDAHSLTHMSFVFVSIKFSFHSDPVFYFMIYYTPLGFEIRHVVLCNNFFNCPLTGPSHLRYDRQSFSWTNIHTHLHKRVNWISIHNFIIPFCYLLRAAVVLLAPPLTCTALTMLFLKHKTPVLGTVLFIQHIF